jgi:hypothetical protein
LNRTIPTLVLLATVLALPLAAAHVEGFSQSKTVAAGPYTVFLQPKPDVIFANTTVTISAQVADNMTGALARNLTATMLVGGPEGFNKRSEMRYDAGYFLGVTALPHRGNYSFRLLLKEASGTTHVAETELEAYPDIAVRIRSADATEDVFVGQPASLTFQVVNATTLQPTDGYDDLKILYERWSDDHGAMLGVEEGSIAKIGKGLWQANHTFTERGMYHLKFASQAGGFTFADVPILHTYATAPPQPDIEEEPERSVPAPGLAPLAFALGIVALLALRRRVP